VRVFRGLPHSANAAVALTIGTFDGIHRGHQAMLSRLAEAADDLALTPAVLTFEPYPREFFARESAPPRLSSLRTKIERFAANGVEHVYIARFDAALAAMAPERFVDDVLVRRLGARWVLVGEDFRYGKARAGDLALLRAAARSFSVEAMRTVEVEGKRASSTAIRAALAAGDIEHATALLGRPFTIAGRVAHGKKVGRSLGFPTANIAIRYKPPFTGVFAVRVHGLGGAARSGVASLGVRPTLYDEPRPLLEVFVFDFDESIYGHHVVVEFLHKLRDQERYADLGALTLQIRADVARARDYFAAVR
jgi:riboflavin kinase/FMN adenylyltransferase